MKDIICTYRFVTIHEDMHTIIDLQLLLKLVFIADHRLFTEISVTASGREGKLFVKTVI